MSYSAVSDSPCRHKELRAQAGTQGPTRVMEAHGVEGSAVLEQSRQNSLGMMSAHLIQVNESSEERRMSRGIGIKGLNN